MNVPAWVTELVEAFWQEADVAAPFPRDLGPAIAYALPLTVVRLPRLHVVDLRGWLRAQEVACACPEADRPLRACLAAQGGMGIIFLDGTDPADEQRFSLAHELGHFLRHYRQPRQRTLRQLGAEIADVLDGLRPPTAQERLRGLLRDVPLGLHLHLLRRGRRRRIVNAAVAQAEEEADRLAYELLAPAAEVLARSPLDRDQVCAVLREVYGLPAVQAEDYSRLLVVPRPEDPLLQRLRS